jgi:hypothetical protein
MPDEIFLLGILLLEPCISLTYAILRERSWCLLRDAQLRSSRWNIVDGRVVSSDNILSTTPQLSVSQKALGTLPEDGNVMPKLLGATIHNKLNEQLVYLLGFHAYFYWGF